jgi:TMEM175 potassium channel family protein
MAGADEERPEVDSHDQVYGLGRLLALSDGVFAFAMTLLVVQLLVPQLARGQGGQLGSKLLDQLPSYFSYFISFAVISIYWYSHHRLFRYVRRWDTWLIVLNLGALLFIAVMPFPTAIMGRYGDQTLAVVIYAAILGSTGLCLWLMWWYGIRRHLFTTRLEQHSARQFRWRAFLTPAVFFLSIPVAFWQPRVAQFSWGLIWLGIYVLSRPRRREPHAR